MKRAWLILGAMSGIARAAAAALASEGHALYLAGRDEEELRRIASDLRIRYGAEAHCGLFEAQDYASHPGFLEGVVRTLGGLDGVILAFGYLGDQARAQADAEEGLRIINQNFTGAASILSCCANHFEAQRSGTIVGISSVAGDRGRQSNYFYGSAKGALSLFLQGLRNRLFPFGVRVITIKPGFVDTAMTYGRRESWLMASPAYVGRRVAAADRSSDVQYVPWFWRYILFCIRLVPESLFKRMKL